MAVALDASTPIRWSGTPTGTAVLTSTPAFTAPTNAFLVVAITADSAAGVNYTFTVADSGGLTWTPQVARSPTETTDGGASAIFTAKTTSSVSRTIDVSRSADSTATNRISAVCYVFTGVDVSGTPVDAITASNEGGSTATPLATTSLTPGANGVLVVAACEWNTKGACTSSDLKGIDSVAGSSHAEYVGAIDVIDGWKTCTSGVGVTGNLQAGAAGPQWKWCQIIVREAATASLSGLARPQSRPFPFAPGSSGMSGRL